MRRRFFLVLAACALLALGCSCVSTGAPKPLSTDYLRTFGAGFFYSRDTHAWTLFIHVVPRRKAPDGGPLYLTASFENPQQGAPVLIARGDSTQATDIGVALVSPPVKGMQDRRIYTIIVRAYADKARTRLLDTLQQTMIYRYVGDPEAIMHGSPIMVPRGMSIAYPTKKVDRN